MNTLRARIIKLAGIIKNAQDANVTRGDYFGSSFDTIEGSGSSRGNPGPYDGSPANDASVDPRDEETREQDVVKVPRRDISLSVVSRDGALASDGGMHFGDVVNIAPSGEGVVSLF